MFGGDRKDAKIRKFICKENVRGGERAAPNYSTCRIVRTVGHVHATAISLKCCRVPAASVKLCPSTTPELERASGTNSHGGTRIDESILCIMRLSDFVTETETSSITLNGRQQVERVPGLGMAALQLPGARTRRARLIEAVIAHECNNAQRDGRGRGGDEGSAPLNDGRVRRRRGACKKENRGEKNT